MKMKCNTIVEVFDSQNEAKDRWRKGIKFFKNFLVAAMQNPYRIAVDMGGGRRYEIFFLSKAHYETWCQGRYYYKYGKLYYGGYELKGGQHEK